MGDGAVCVDDSGTGSQGAGGALSRGADGAGAPGSATTRAGVAGGA
ncbi:MAG: PE family protein, partial [Actinobacteria bacterium HGW-Actinobacteria-5]